MVERGEGNQTVDSPGLLFVWTDVDEKFEEDFNRWYDREHIEERVRIPGVFSGTRYRNIDAGRRYLGLYCTESLAVFDSDGYRAAFTSQTPWSRTNLSRMREPMRRVCAVVSKTGFGTGAWLAVLPLPSNFVPEAAKAAGNKLQGLDGVISIRLLIPDVEKSTPLPNERLDARTIEPILLIDASTEIAAREVAEQAGSILIRDGGSKPSIFSMIWQLTSLDLPAS